MKLVAYDLETELIAPGNPCPRIVCGSQDDGTPTFTFSPVAEFIRLAADPDVVIAGANIAFDFGCIAAACPELLPTIFGLYEAGRVHDVLISEALHAIAGGQLFRDPRTGGPLTDPETGKQRGRYSLAIVADLCLGEKGAKANDYWRMRYAILDVLQQRDIEWPAEAVEYAKDDARNTRRIAEFQVANHRNQGDLPAQVFAAWCLHLSSVWGVRTDGPFVEALKAEALAAEAEAVARFTDVGFLRPNGTTDTAVVKRAVAMAYGASEVCPECVGGKVNSAKTSKPVACSACCGTALVLGRGVRRTEKNGLACDGDTLLESGDETLMAWASIDDKTLGTYLPFLVQGTRWPICPSPNVLVESGRVSYSGPIQTIPRGGKLRNAFRPRPGFYYSSADGAAIELCGLAQVCLNVVGRSVMADTINASKDPGALHTLFASKMIGCAPEALAARIKAKDPVAKNYRQAAKALNFGLGGGMGAVRFVVSKRRSIEGSTTAQDGTVCAGLRFCVLIKGAERCGVKKTTEWKGRPCPPICLACVEIVEQLRRDWFALFSEVKEFHAWVSQQVDSNGELTQFGSNRVRGGLGFTDGSNTLFQGLIADGAKHALCQITREAYCEPASALWGSRVAFFAHDEIMLEVPIEKAHEAGYRQAGILVESWRRFIPDVWVVCEPALQLCWDKNAETVLKDGRLIPWVGNGV